MLGLARLGPRAALPPGGEGLYRHLARLAELGPDREFLVVPCGQAAATEFLARTTGAAGSGVDPDEGLVERATERAKAAGLAERLHYEHAPLEDLPYQDAVFDVAIGDIGLAAAADVEAAVRELVRVTRPMGSVLLVQLVWTGNVSPERRQAVEEHLGVRPLVLVEWKQLLRDAGVVELHVEDWADGAGDHRQRAALRGLVEFLSLRDRLEMLWRAGRQWGWRGVPAALARDRQVRALLTRERVLGLSVIKGTRWQAPPDASP
ncbi:MAG TPA: methyltransferase domain-containing protein [Longimicrobiales bacterium]